jgi:hypothetical protein
LTLGRRFLNSQPDIIDDRIDVVCRGTMAITVGCARCHDHKFDPIPQKDYYALYGIFASSVEPKDLPLLPESRDAATTVEYDRQLGERRKTIDEFEERKAAQESWLLSLSLQTPVALAPQAVVKTFNRADREALTKLRAKIDELNAGPLSPPRAMALVDAPQPVTPHVFIRGNPGRLGDEVPRRFLTVLSHGDPKPFQHGSGRLELAEAIVDPQNPLTPRVIVNRVWLHHFGLGLVRTPSDFGVKGELPTHPELLDWLASRLLADGWSLKKLQRVIMLSSAYQQSSDVSEKAARLDPENRLVSRMNRQRLDFEATRDALLFAVGKLDLTMGGRGVELMKSPYPARRAVYGYIDRQNLPGTFRVFDFASPDTTSPQRHVKTVPQQALFMMNSPFVLQQAKALATPAPPSSPTEADIQSLYERVYARRAAPEEVAAALRFLNAPPAPEPEQVTPTWQYGWGGYDAAAHSVNFHPLPHWSGSTWQGGPKMPDRDLAYVSLNAGGGHPGRDNQHAAIRRWVAPADDVVSVSGKLERPDEHGDGVLGRVVSSRQGEVAQFLAEPKAAVATPVERIEVKKGDTLDFVVECRDNDTSDSFRWSPVIHGQKGEWSAEPSFAGPPPPLGPQLTAWEQYAQVLLASNEFVFID